MELRQESLFADETKGGIEVIYSKFIDQRRMDYKALFGGFDHLRVITFSYGLGFVETVADMFEDVEIIIGSMKDVYKRQGEGHPRGCPFSWREYVVLWFAILVECHIAIIESQATERGRNRI